MLGDQWHAAPCGRPKNGAVALEPCGGWRGGVFRVGQGQTWLSNGPVVASRWAVVRYSAAHGMLGAVDPWDASPLSLRLHVAGGCRVAKHWRR